MALDGEARPYLGRGVRLRLDRLSGKVLLLRSEQGFELQGSAAEIVKLCAGDLTLEAMLDRLAEAHPETSRAEIAADARRLLADLGRRGVIAWEPR